MWRLLLLTLVTLVNGCASTAPVLVSDKVNSEITPDADTATIDQNVGKTIRWGGQIVTITNNERDTRLQVLSYPLRKNHRPNDARRSNGRFVLIYNEFLEPYDYAPGKFVSAVGDVSGVMSESIGESKVDIPMINAHQIHLWRPQDARILPFFSIGVGIGL